MADNNTLYRVTIPSAGTPDKNLWDSDKLERNYDKLMADHPDAIVEEATPNGRYNVKVKSKGYESEWDSGRYNANFSKLQNDYSDATAEPLYDYKKYERKAAETEPAKPEAPVAPAPAEEQTTQPVFNDEPVAAKPSSYTQQNFGVGTEKNMLWGKKEDKSAYQKIAPAPTDEENAASLARDFAESQKLAQRLSSLESARQDARKDGNAPYMQTSVEKYGSANGERIDTKDRAAYKDERKAINEEMRKVQERIDKNPAYTKMREEMANAVGKMKSDETVSNTEIMAEFNARHKDNVWKFDDPWFTQENNELSRNHSAAQSFYKDAQNILLAPMKYDDNGNFLLNMGRGAKDVVLDKSFWTLGISDISDNSAVIDAFKKLQDKGVNLNDLERGVSEIADKDGNPVLTKSEANMVDAYLTLQSAKALRMNDVAGGYNAGQIAAESVDMMVGMLATGGIASAASSGLKKFLTKQIVKTTSKISNKFAKAAAKEGMGLAERVIVEGVGSAAASPFTPLAAKAITESKLQIGEDGKMKGDWESMKDGLFTGWSEYFTERMGPSVNSAFKNTAKLIGINKLGDFIKGNSKFLREIGEKAGLVKMPELMKNAAFDGVLGEMGEEYLNAVIDRIRGNENALNDFTNWDSLLEMAGGFAIPSVIGLTVSAGNVLTKSHDLNKKTDKLSGLLRNLTFADGTKLSDEKIQHILDLGRANYSYDEEGKLRYENGDVDNVDELRKQLSSIGANADNTSIRGALLALGRNVDTIADQDLKKELFNALGDYYKSCAQWQTVTGLYNGQQQKRIDDKKAEIMQSVGDKPFWGKINTGTGVDANYVEVAKLLDGTECFVLAEYADGKPNVMEDGRVPAIKADGSGLVYISQQDVQGPTTIYNSVDEYVNYRIIKDEETQKEEVAADTMEQIAAQEEQTGEEASEEQIKNEVALSEIKRKYSDSIGDEIEIPTEDGTGTRKITITSVSEDGIEADAEDGTSPSFTWGQVQSWEPKEQSEEPVQTQEQPAEQGQPPIESAPIQQPEAPQEPAESAEAAESAPTEPKKEYPLDKDGNIDLDKLLEQDPMEFWYVGSQELGDRDIVKKAMADRLAGLKKALDKEKSLNAKRTILADIKKLEEAIAKVEELQWQNKGDEKAPEAAETKGSLARKKAAEEAIAAAEAGRPKMIARWQNSRRFDGNADSFVDADGNVIPGKWALVNVSSLTPSHNPLNGYEISEGATLDENGKTLNDRDYKNDKDAQAYVEKMAKDYDARAWADPIVVNPESGEILSGNNRVQSAILAASNGTNKKYLEHARQYAGSRGFKPEDVDSYDVNDPAIAVFIPDEALPMTSETFARFNKDAKKGQNKTEKAVKMGKVVSEKAINDIAKTIDKFEDFNAVCNDENAVAEILSILVNDGVIGENELPALKEGNKLSGQGRDVVESAIVGNLLAEDALRIAMEDRNIRQPIVSAIAQIIKNRSLGEEYALTNELSDAVILLDKARRNGVKVGESVQGYLRQYELFENIDKTYEATVQLLADCINKKAFTLFKKVLSSYNDEAFAALNGDINMFNGQSKEEILAPIIKEILGYEIKTTDGANKEPAAGPEEPKSNEPPTTKEGQPGETGSAVQGSTGSGDVSGEGNGEVGKGEPTGPKEGETPKEEGPKEGPKNPFEAAQKALEGGERQEPKEKPLDGKKEGESNGEDDFFERNSGSENKYFKKDDAREALRRLMGKLRAGFDPEMFKDSLTVAGYLIESGIRKFADFANELIKACGDAIRPYLKSMYEGIRNYPGMEEYSKEMTPREEVDKIDILNFNKKEEQTSTKNKEVTTNNTEDPSLFAVEDENITSDLQEETKVDNNKIKNTENANEKRTESNQVAEGRSGVPNRGIQLDNIHSGSDGGKAGEGTENPAEKQGENGGVANNGGKEVVGDGIRNDIKVGYADGEGSSEGANIGGISVPVTAESKIKKAKEEAPINQRNFFFTAESKERFDSISGSEKLKANIDALEIIATCRNEGRDATSEERARLAMFKGWGGLELERRFYSLQSRWASYEDRRLFKVLNDIYGSNAATAYSEIVKSSLTSFYTPAEVASAINTFIEKCGIHQGSFLDGSIGGGIFEGTLPDNLRTRLQITGVELDPVTAEMAMLLYPDAKIINSGLQDANLAPGTFDVVEGNDPFGDIEVYDSSWASNNSQPKRLSQKRIHNYFAVKKLDLTRPGGVCVTMTTKSVLDTPGNKFVREYIADNSEIIGIVRLPKETFSKSGTAAVTDVLFLRKFKNDSDRKATLENEKYKASILEPFLSTTTKDVEYNGEKITVEYNGYFGINTDMMLGQIIAGDQYRIDSFGLSSPESSTKDIADFIRQSVSKMLNGREGDIFNVSTTKKDTAEAIREGYIGDGKYNSSGNLVVQNGKVGTIEVKKNTLGVKSLEFVEITDKSITKEYNRVEAISDLRTAMKKLISQQINSDSDEIKAQSRAELNRSYNNFINKYGRLNNNINIAILTNDIDGLALLNLEVIDKKTGKVVGLSDIFTKDTIGAKINDSEIKEPKDAIASSLGQFGELRPSYMKDKLGDDWIEKCGDLVFINPSSGFAESREDYLSGDVVTKLEVARSAAETYPEYERNVRELQKVQPVAVGFEDIWCPLGSRWIPDSMYTDFVKNLCGDNGYSGKTRVEYSTGLSEYKIEVDDYYKDNGGSVSRWKTDRVPFTRILSCAFSGTYPTVYDTLPDYSKVINKEETELAKSIVDNVKEEFSIWLSSNTERSISIQNLYNGIFNRNNVVKYDGSHISPAGLIGMQLRKHQQDAVWKILHNMGGLIDHEMGAGKTLVMQTASMELRRMGLARKPMILATKSTAVQIAKEFIQAYPGARILAPAESDFSKKNRQNLLRKIALNDYDCIIITHDNYNKLDHSDDAITSVYSEILNELDSTLEVMRSSNKQDALTKRQIKAAEKKKLSIQAKLKKLMDSQNIDKGITFEDLGVDFLFVDEMQYYKNLSYITKLQNIKGLNPPEGTSGTEMLRIGVRYLQRMHQGDKGVCFLSGTVLSNSLTELYNIFQYLRPNELSRLGIDCFDAWANVFTVAESDAEYGVTNELKEQTRFRQFKNLNQLSSMYRELADIVTQQDLVNLGVKLPTPHVKVITIPKTEDIERLNRQVVRMVKTGDISYFGHPQSETGKNPVGLLASTDSGKIALGPKIIMPHLPEEGSKIAYAAKNIADVYFQREGTSKDPLGVQFVFIDSSAPSKIKYNAYDAIIRLLVEEYGIPREHIADTHEYDTAEKKKVLFSRANEGLVRILLGNRKTLGTGVNAQKHAVAAHNVDLWWNPSPINQGNKRVIRQGNLNDDVDIYYYATESTLDLYKYQLNGVKDKFFNDFKSGTMDNEFNDEAGGDEKTLDPNAVVATLSGKPIVLERAKALHALEKLRKSRNNFLRTYSDMVSARDKAIKRADSERLNIEKNDRDEKFLADAGFKRSESYPIDYIVRNEKLGTEKRFDKAKEAGEYINLLMKDAIPFTINGYGIKAKVYREVNGDKYLEASNLPSGILYRAKMSSDPVQLGQVMRDLRERVDKNADFYRKKLAEYEKAINDNNPGDGVFPKQEELKAAEEKFRNIDAEYKLLINENSGEDELAQKEYLEEMERRRKEHEQVEASDDFDIPTGNNEVNYSLQSEEERTINDSASTSVEDKIDTIEIMADAYGTDVDVYVDSRYLPKGVKKTARGFFDTKTGKIGIALSNCKNVDVVADVMLHEAVGHKGLRALFGEDFKTAMQNVYDNAAEEIKKQIDSMVKSGRVKDVIEGAEEYISRLGERGPQTAEEMGLWEKIRSWLVSMLRKAGVKIKKLTDADLRALFFESEHALKKARNLFEQANVTVVRERLKEEAYRSHEEEGEDGGPDNNGGGNKNEGETENGEDSLRFSDVNDAIPDDSRLSVSSLEDVWEYGKMAKSWKTRLVESAFDKYIALRKALDIMSGGKNGSALKSGENVADRLNQVSSKFSDEQRKFNHEVMLPLIKTRDGLITRKNNPLTEDELTEYMALKNGMERQVVMAKNEASDAVKTRAEGAVKKEEERFKNEMRSLEGKKDKAELLGIDTDPILKEISEAQAKHEEKLTKIAEDMQDNLERIEAGDDTQSDYKKAREKEYGAIRIWFAKYVDSAGNEIDGMPEYEPGESREQYNARISRMLRYSDDNMPDAEDRAEKRIAELEDKIGKSEVKKLWEDTKKATDYTVNLQYQYGLISKEQRDNVLSMYEHYVPLRGFQLDTAGDLYDFYGVKSQEGKEYPFIRAKGRSSKPESAFSHIAAMHDVASAGAFKNEAFNALRRFVANHPDQHIAKIAKVWYVKSTNPITGEEEWRRTFAPITSEMTIDEQNETMREFEYQMKALKAQGLATEKKNRTNYFGAVVNATDAQKEEGVIFGKNLGRDVAIIFNGNPLAAQEFKDMIQENLDVPKWLEWYGAARNYFSRANTSYRLAFSMGTNLQRDLLHATVNNFVNENPRFLLHYAKNVPSAFKIIGYFVGGDKLREGDDISDGDRKLFAEYMKGGAPTGIAYVQNHDEYERAFDKELKRQFATSNDLTEAMKAVGHLYLRFGEAFEQISRFATFKTARELGFGIEDSVAKAKNVTLNFDERGTRNAIGWSDAGKFGYGKDGTQTFNKWNPFHVAARALVVGLSNVANLGQFVIPYFGAMLQSLYNQLKNAKNHTEKFAASTAFFIGLGYLIGTPLISALAPDDDDDEEAKKAKQERLDRYTSKNQYQRQNQLITPALLGSNLAFSWAIPQEFVPFVAIGDNISRVQMGLQNPGKALTQSMDAMANEYLTVSPSKIRHNLFGISTLWDIMSNRNFQGMPISRRNQYNEGLPGFRMASNQTWDWLTDFCEAINTWGGGDYSYASNIGRLADPALAQHVIEDFAGGYIKDFGQVVNLAGKIGNPNREWTVRDIPVLNRYVYNYDSPWSNPAVREQYDYYKKLADRGKQSFNDFKKNAAITENGKIMQSDEFQFARIYDAFNGAMKDVYDNINKYQQLNVPEREIKSLYNMLDELKAAFVDECRSYEAEKKSKNGKDYMKQ